MTCWMRLQLGREIAPPPHIQPCLFRHRCVLVVLVLIGVSIALGLRKRERDRNMAKLIQLRAKYAAAQPKSNPAYANLTKRSQVVPEPELKVEAVE